MNHEGLDSLEHRQMVDRGLEEEHEYLLFVSETGDDHSEISLDVFLTEGTLTVTADTDVSLRQFLESVESWYPVKGRDVETYALKDGEWSEERPRDVIFEDDIEIFDFHFYDDFDYFNVSWEKYSKASEDFPENEVSMSLDYDNADRMPHPESLEPLRKVMPKLLEQESEGHYQVIGDLIKYLNHSNDFKNSYPALTGFNDKLIEHYLET